MRYPFLSSSKTPVKPCHLPCRLTKVWLRIRPERIHMLKYILEGYDGLGLLSTFDVKQGVMVLSCPPQLLVELFVLLADLAPGLAYTSNPEKLIKQ